MQAMTWIIQLPDHSAIGHVSAILLPYRSVNRIFTVQCYSYPMVFSLNVFVFNPLLFLAINYVDFVYVDAFIFQRLDLVFGMIQL